MLILLPILCILCYGFEFGIAGITTQIVKKSKDQLILCEHCRRTATNGIKCQGICVANSSY